MHAQATDECAVSGEQLTLLGPQNSARSVYWLKYREPLKYLLGPMVAAALEHEILTHVEK